jgi:hypothetical protein
MRCSAQAIVCERHVDNGSCCCFDGQTALLQHRRSSEQQGEQQCKESVSKMLSKLVGWLVGWLVGCHFGRLILDANHHSSFSLTKMFPCPSTPGSNKSWQESTADKEQALLSPVSEMKSTTTGHFGCHCIPSWSSSAQQARENGTRRCSRPALQSMWLDLPLSHAF